MYIVFLLLNAVASVSSAAWAGVALFRPASLSGSSQISRGEMFYVHMYAARAIPFGLAAGILPFFLRGKAVACVLFIAAVIQIGDVVIAVARKERGMVMGASIGATLHICCGVAVM